MPFSVGRKANVLMVRIVLFAKLNFVTRCESGICITPSNTRIFASDFQFGEFRAILRGVVVKKIHNFDRHFGNRNDLEMLGIFGASDLRAWDDNRPSFFHRYLLEKR